MRLNDLPLLLDRDREVASLDAVLEGLERGEAHTLLIEGRAGIGKSRLMAELRERAAGAGIRVLGARGSELEREFAFGVVRQLFEPAVADPATRPALLAGAAASAEQVLDPPTGEDGPPTDASFAALHGLYWLTANLAAEEPLVIAVDDLHWCDVPSLRFLAYTVKRLEGLPLLLTACLRPSEPGTDATLLGEIANDPATILLQPGPLGAEAIGEIVRDRLGTLPDGRFAQATHKATGGNPLLLHELVKTMAAEGVPPDADHAAVMRDIGPRAVTRTVLTRLARLGSRRRAGGPGRRRARRGRRPAFGGQPGRRVGGARGRGHGRAGPGGDPAPGAAAGLRAPAAARGDLPRAAAGRARARPRPRRRAAARGRGPAREGGRPPAGGPPPGRPRGRRPAGAGRAQGPPPGWRGERGGLPAPGAGGAARLGAAPGPAPGAGAPARST